MCETGSLIGVSSQEINTHPGGREVFGDYLLDCFDVELFATKNIKVSSSVEFHEMPRQVAGGDQLQHAETLFGISGQEILDDGLTMCGHVDPFDKILGKTVDIITVVDASTSTAI